MSNVFTAQALCTQLDGQLVGDGRINVHGVSMLEHATDTQAAWYGQRRYKWALEETAAGLIICPPHLADDIPAGQAHLICADDRASWGALLRLYYPRPTVAQPAIGVHPLAWCDSSAHIDSTARIGPFVSIEANVYIGAQVSVHAGARIGNGVRIDTECTIMHNAVILAGATIEHHCWIGPGAVIGSDGFGLDAQGRLPHIGRVVIGPEVTIGANTCIDRGTLGDTRVGAHTHIDNLVQIGHNAEVGSGVVLCGQVGVAGSAVIGDGAVIGGQAGVAQHARVGHGCRVAAQSGVTRHLKGPGTYSGHPAEPNQERLRRIARVRKHFSTS